ncbi:MAG: sigma 54-interacting transcriptional regulator, partial [Planctomycetota bacterium]
MTTPTTPPSPSGDEQRALLQSATDMLFLLDLEGGLRFANHWPMPGTSGGPLPDTPFTALLPPAERRDFEGALDAVLQDGMPQSFKSILRGPDGDDLPVRIDLNAVFDGAGRLVSVAGQAKDMRELVAARASSTGGLAPLPRDSNSPPGGAALLSEHPSMLLVLRQLESLHDLDDPVLVCGEPGTGKELVARAIHADSKRHGGPFVAVSCVALTDAALTTRLFGRDGHGLAHDAQGGTLYLDQVGTMRRATQARLLTLLRDGRASGRRVDVRVVAASHRDLDELCRSGDLSSELLELLGAIRIQLPPLRLRDSDVSLLVAHALTLVEQETRRRWSMDPKALEVLQRYSWPGNVRELLNVVRAATRGAQGDVLSVSDLPPSIRDGQSGGADDAPVRAMREVERSAIEKALAAASGNRKRAAEILGMPRATFYRRLKQYG